MSKTILLTGASDGIGLEAAKKLAALGHRVLRHGRNPNKLQDAMQAVQAASPDDTLETYIADLSNMADVDALAAAIHERHDHLDVVINNAGVLKAPNPILASGEDIRFVVNTVAPYRLTKLLLPLLGADGRIVNLSSAAQAPVDAAALAGQRQLADMEAYSQSKLAITMWSRHLADTLGSAGPVVVAVNPGSLLATKMVQEGFGVAGSDINIGADILVRASLDEEFADASGAYFDNDARAFGSPHPDALDAAKNAALVEQLDQMIG